jgi:hypothetical protein
VQLYLSLDFLIIDLVIRANPNKLGGIPPVKNIF